MRNTLILQKKEDEDEDAKVEEDKEEEKKPKTKKVEKTVWDWEILNGAKPIWLRKQKEVTDEEYEEFYKAITKVRILETQKFNKNH